MYASLHVQVLVLMMCVVLVCVGTADDHVGTVGYVHVVDGVAICVELISCVGVCNVGAVDCCVFVVGVVPVGVYVCVGVGVFHG